MVLVQNLWIFRDNQMSNRRDRIQLSLEDDNEYPLLSSMIIMRTNMT